MANQRITRKAAPQPTSQIRRLAQQVRRGNKEAVIQHFHSMQPLPAAALAVHLFQFLQDTALASNLRAYLGTLSRSGKNRARPKRTKTIESSAKPIIRAKPSKSKIVRSKNTRSSPVKAKPSLRGSECLKCQGIGYVTGRTCTRCEGKGWLSSDEVHAPTDGPSLTTGVKWAECYKCNRRDPVGSFSSTLLGKYECPRCAGAKHRF
jgi:hypothetical protein